MRRPLSFSPGTEMSRPPCVPMKAGAVEFLLKPFDNEELLKAIDAAIAKDREARLKRAETADLRQALRPADPA